MVTVLWDSTVCILIGEQPISRKHNTSWKVLTCLLETSLRACTHTRSHTYVTTMALTTHPQLFSKNPTLQLLQLSIYQKHIFPRILKLRNITYVDWSCFPGDEIYLQANTHICGHCLLLMDSKIEGTRSTTLEPKDAYGMCREHPCYPTAPTPWKTLLATCTTSLSVRHLEFSKLTQTAAHKTSQDWAQHKRNQVTRYIFKNLVFKRAAGSLSLLL